MPTPAERIYEAAIAKLAAQQAAVGRLASAVSPLAAAATAAGAVLFKPATDGLQHQEWLQVTGLVIASVGFVALLWWGIKASVGITLPGAQPRTLFQVADQGPSWERPDTFHLDAAVSVEDVWMDSRGKIRGTVVRWFALFVLGIFLELAGLTVAVLARPGAASPPKPPTAASLHVTSGYLNRGGMGFSGEIAAGARGRVQIAVTLLGRGGEVVSRDPAIHGGRFAIQVPAGAAFPLRSASYTITWTGSSSVAGESLTGELARCPEDCQ
ncbi:MAG: hypothetical protein E6G34_06505 [Actinobacteria bacterium]|nr:MAG: hypothetical protein E6G34_06505 [Actinomycetota bacterium]